MRNNFVGDINTKGSISLWFKIAPGFGGQEAGLINNGDCDNNAPFAINLDSNGVYASLSTVQAQFRLNSIAVGCVIDVGLSSMVVRGHFYYDFYFGNCLLKARIDIGRCYCRLAFVQYLVRLVMHVDLSWREF